MTVRRAVAKNTAAQGLSTLFSMGLGAISAAVLSRHLGVEGFGQFNYLFAFFAFFFGLNDFGVSNTAMIRALSRQPAEIARILGGAFPFKLFISVLVLLSSWLLILHLRFPPALKQSLLLFGLFVPLTALELPVVIYHAQLKLDQLSFLSALNRMIGFALLMLVVSLGLHLRAAVFALVLAEVFYICLLFWSSRRWVRFPWRLDPPFWKILLRSSIPLGLMSFLASVVNRSAFIFLEKRDAHSLGLYAAAHKITVITETLPFLVMGSAYPLFCRYASEDLPRLRSFYRTCLMSMGLLGVCLGFSVTFFSGFVIRKMFGSAFSDASQVLSILIWATAFAYPFICSANLLISIGREGVNLGIFLAAAVLSAGLNLLWVPSEGALGAAFAQTVTYGFLLSATFLCVERDFRSRMRGPTKISRPSPSTYLPRISSLPVDGQEL